MKIIPVIDYKLGHVVLAKMGNRDEYVPINSKLCTSSNIYDVVDSILTLASFKTIYIADLDCIENQHLDTQLWQSLCKNYPQINFWIDLGKACNRWPNFMQDVTNARPIISTESFASEYDVELSINLLSKYQPLLSIDTKNNSLLGPKNLQLHKYTMISEIIVLSINHGGSYEGPNIEIIKKFRSLNSSLRMHYGGGIRDAKDIQQVASMNIDSVLIASTLHNGDISQKELAQFTS